jgi:predicted nucleic acid-binding protein
MTRRVGAKGQVVIPKVNAERVLAAGHIKAEHRVAFADCFAVATAAARDATLFTGDPELLERDVGCRTRDLRAI